MIDDDDSFLLFVILSPLKSSIISKRLAQLCLNTKLHFVGDGAKWITEQTERVFGIQASYLIDLYHLCEYLSSAADVCAPDDKRGWPAIQKKRMESNYSDGVLKALSRTLRQKKCLTNKPQ